MNNYRNNCSLVQHFLEFSTERLPDKVALICGDQRLTYQQINRLADQLATALSDLGIEYQDRVVILLDNSVDAVISLFGILKVGGTFIMLNAAMKSKKLNYILKDSGARVLITQINKSRVVAEAIKDAAELEHIIWCRTEEAPQVKNLHSTLKTSTCWSSLLESAKPDNKSYDPLIDIDLATIIYTSGSTGEPKGVMSAHYNVLAAAKSITTYLQNVEDDIILNALPLSFDYGLYQVLMAFYLGATVVIESSFTYPHQVIERIRAEGVTGFPIVPTMAAILFQLKDLYKYDFSSIRYISNTAAALPVPYIRKLQSIFPQAQIFSMYGLTECKRVSYLPPEYLHSKSESVGIPMPNCQVQIVDENGQPLGPDEVGELVIKGSNVMQGYWNDPEATARTFRPGNYRNDVLLHTGDLFRKDEDGFLYYVNRKDDLIKAKGERVSPKEIENVIHDIEGVLEVAVFGVPDDIFGQAVKAFVVPDINKELTEKMILRYCQNHLEPFMVPKYIEIRSNLPKTPNGKVDKKRLG